ncbi:response regulator [Clostridium sp. P21]|uniref:Stage 0 sporulation protein A homolog n=1 Tax=Clostridium muellerianum TaxID=2716538 RepID=A0A7Y0ELT8_9CLOT|nr:response regulator [Clostridium muellerianum]NMM65782.1 response regulator [Clostridium muellerianum]
MKKVLIVDDTKNIRVLLTTCLELREYEVITADSGKEALNIIKNKKSNIDLIFLDIRMPEMNGTEVLKDIRNMGMECPVIIMTAFATVKNAIDCTKLGAVAYLQKPFSPERVNSVLDEIFNVNNENYFIENKDENVLVEKAKVLIEKCSFVQAENNLKNALAINPYNKEIYFLIGKVNENINNKKEAKRFYAIAELFEKENS